MGLEIGSAKEWEWEWGYGVQKTVCGDRESRRVYVELGSGDLME